MTPRFVVLCHRFPLRSCRASHWDWMFEHGSVLHTWSARRWPAADGVESIRLSDHRIDYLEYEGRVSGDRGSVRRVLRGRYRLVVALPAYRLMSILGPDVTGRVALQRLSPEDREPDRWRLACDLRPLR